MRTVEYNLYQFDELSDSAKERAREWYRTTIDYEWWDFIFDDAKEIGQILGIDISEICFSGFWSQGDGAQFTGDYEYRKGASKKVRQYAPQDKELHRIADELQEIQRRNFYSITASVSNSGRYCHEYCTTINVYDSREVDVSIDTEESIQELMRDYMRWIYRQLQEEYWYLQEDEQVEENILANEYEFTEDGEMA